MIFSDTTYQPSSFSFFKKIWVFLTVIKNPWQLFVDKIGLKREVLYKTFRKTSFYSRSKTTDINEGVVVFSGNEYPPALLDIENNKAPIVLDCGGNIGTFSLYVKELYPSAEIFILEPLAENIELLKRNMEINNLHDVVVIPKAVSTDGKDKNFYVEKNKFDGGSLIAEKNISKTTSKSVIQSITLQDIISENSIKRIDLLKMDIEGSEYDIIQSSKGILSSFVKRIIVEYHTNIKPEGRNFLVNELTKGASFQLIYESKNILGFENTH